MMLHSLAAERSSPIIVGGGVMGCATAYFLAAHHGVLATVLERDPTYSRASSALSASSIRQQFSTPENIALSQWSFKFLKQAHELLAIGDDHPSLGLTERGYLYLASEAGVPALRSNHAVQAACRADIRWLDAGQLGSQFNWLNLTGLAAGTWGASGEGWFDGPALHQALRRKAVALGARFVQANVEAVQLASRDLYQVVSADRTTWKTNQVLIACGAHVNAPIRSLGLAFPISAKKRDVFVFDSPAILGNCPLVIDPSGIWFRPEGQPHRDGSQRFLCGAPPRAIANEPEDPDDAPLDQVDHGLFEEIIWPALAARVPAFEALRLRAAWSGYYEMNAFDHNGLVGEIDSHPGLFIAAGFSGHGMQHAPGVGHAMARLMVGQRADEVAALSPSRVARGQPLLELNVI